MAKLKQKIKDIHKPQINESVDKLVTSSYALLHLLNEVLDACKVNFGEIPLLKREFNLKAKLEEIINLYKAKAEEKGIALLFEYDEDIPQYVIGYSIQIHLTVLELITNALNYTEAGQIKLSVKLAKRNDRDLVIKIIVEDTGIGMPADKQEEVFLQFKHLVPSHEGVYKGTGLSLAVVKQFINSIQGEIYVKSQLQKGTKFTCTIPLREALLEERFSDKERNNCMIEQENLGFGRLKFKKVNKKIMALQERNWLRASDLSTQLSRILLVEDHQIVAKVTKNILLELGCEVDIAENGKIALKLIGENDYDLIFMDIGLPDMDGYVVAKQIRSHRLESIAQTPIVALTAHAESNEKQRCLEAGMNLMITKPLTKKWGESILEVFISERQRHIRQIEQASHTKANTEQVEKIVDFEYAKALLGGNETVAQEALTMLADSLPEEIKALRAAYQHKNWKELRNLAQKLKGGASYFGTLRLKAVCTELDSHIKLGLTTRIPKLYQKILTEIAAIQKFISAQFPV